MRWPFEGPWEGFTPPVRQQEVRGKYLLSLSGLAVPLLRACSLALAADLS